MAKTKKILKLHRGRFQAQGGKPELDKKEPWGEMLPLPYSKGKTLLANLSKQLTPLELNARHSGIIECSQEIKKINSVGGFLVVNKPYGASFPRLSKPDGERIDLEIKLGQAFT